jgi:predicted GNAT family N-acyltransferase
MNAISIIPYGRLTEIIPSILPFLRKSELWSNKRATVDDIVKFLFTGQMHLWILYNPDTLVQQAHIITEVKQYPSSRMLVMQYVAGETGSAAESDDIVYSTLERFAKANNCDGIEFVGRPGWGRYAKQYGFKTHTSTYEKIFE